MNLSLGEIEATAKKAARGAGYPWGLAEDAGFATRWLCAHGLDGCRVLTGVLGRIDGQDISQWTPQIQNDPWTAPKGMLCPVITGTILSDRADRLSGSAFRLGAVLEPALLLPFLRLIAGHFTASIELSIDGQTYRVTQDGYTARTGLPRICHEATVSLGVGNSSPSPVVYRAKPAPDDWSLLLAFAHRTYAPATEASRLKGAGAADDKDD